MPKRKLKFISFVLMIILILPLATACTLEQSKTAAVDPISKEALLLGTFCKVTVYDQTSRDVLEKAFNRIAEIEDKMTINKDTSEIITLNQKSGVEFVTLSPDTFQVIKRALYYSDISKGKFDISIGPWVKLWGIGTPEARVPSQTELDNARPLINYKNILLDEKNSKAMLKEKGMIVDLGAIAKGYAADEVKRILSENGVNHAIINLGGNIYAMGTKPDKSDWKIGIQNPFEPTGDYLGIIGVSDKTVVTSGVYERFFEKDGKSYHHILDTETGYPVKNSLVGVSIIADRSIDGDALSTSVFSLGLEKGMELIESLDTVDAIFITSDYEIYLSSGLKDKLTLTDTSFKIIN